MLSINMRSKQTGSALPIVLILLTLLTAAAVSVMQSAIANSRLSGSMMAAREAFRLASHGTATGLRSVTDDPTTLPAADDIYRFPTADSGIHSDLRHTSGPSGCNDLAPLPGIRHDFEIRATGEASRGAISHHRQGFYICSEDCGGQACIGVETLPHSTYWYVTRPDMP